MAMGEKPTISLISAAASARMAVAESLMNLGAADIRGKGDLKRVKLSANWMAAVNHPGQAAELYDAVHAIGVSKSTSSFAPKTPVLRVVRHVSAPSSYSRRLC